MGYKDIKHGKEQIIKLLKKYFKENEDYKILSNSEFDINNFCACVSREQNNSDESEYIEEKSGAHNKQYTTVSSDCFKELCMHIGTQKSKEIKKFYIELEKIFKIYLEYQNKCQVMLLNESNKLLEESKQELIEEKISNKEQQKLERHNLLIDKFKNKKCIYLAEIEEDKYIKIGSSKDINDRQCGLKYKYKVKYIIDVFECDNHIEVERLIFNNDIIKAYLYKEELNNNISKEIIKLNKEFNYKQLLSIITNIINNSNSDFLTPLQLLEKQRLDNETKRLDIISKLIDNGYNPDIINNRNIQTNNIETNNDEKKINNNILDKEQVLSIFKEIIQDMDTNNDKRIIDKENEYKDIFKNEMQKFNEQYIVPENIILNVSKRTPKGRKIQKIDPNNFNNIIKVYDSMIYLLRSSECIGYQKSSIQTAIKNNKIYKGYRWNFVEKNEDPNISNISETVNNKNKAPIIDTIIELNETKTSILNTYKNKDMAAKMNKIGKIKMVNIINNNEKYNNNYYIKLSECDKKLLDSYNKPIYKNVSKNATSIVQLNPINNDKHIFNTIGEIYIKLGISEKSIKNAINSKYLYNGFYWKYLD